MDVDLIGKSSDIAFNSDEVTYNIYVNHPNLPLEGKLLQQKLKICKTLAPFHNAAGYCPQNRRK